MSDDGTFDPAVFLAFGRDVLSRQAFSMLLGAELVALRPGHVELALPLSDKLRQQDGFAHGGVLAYLADNALTYAGGTALRVPVVTAEFKINYLRPAVGERLVARARAVHVGKTQAVCQCEVFSMMDGVEKPVALAQGTIQKRGDAPPAS
jgi:uncharacterized protein (TIGR00369 family)